MDFKIEKDDYLALLLVTSFLISIVLIIVKSNYFSRIMYRSKYFFIYRYYSLTTNFQKVGKIYAWLYSVFFDNTEEFEQKYSRFGSTRYKKKKEQQSSSFYTNFDQTPYQKTKTNTNQQTNNYIKKDPYEQFYSTCNYTVLGVPYGSDFKKVIRPAYIKLINKYHTDKLISTNKKFDKKLYAEISKQINAAYDNLKRENKH